MAPGSNLCKIFFSLLFLSHLLVSLFFRFSVLGTMTPGRGQRYSIDWYHRNTILAPLSTDLPTQYDMYMDDNCTRGKICKTENIILFSGTFLISWNHFVGANLLCFQVVVTFGFDFHSPNEKYLRDTGFNAVFEAVSQCELCYCEVLL